MDGNSNDTQVLHGYNTLVRAFIGKRGPDQLAPNTSVRNTGKMLLFLIGIKFISLPVRVILRLIVVEVFQV
jgi:hypothetical protein